MKKAKPLLRSCLYLMIAISAGLVFSSCDRTRNEKGYEYFPDMAHSQAFETYAPNPNFGDGATNQMSVAGTVSREFLPFDYPSNVEGRIKAGKEVFNPLPVTSENIEVGREQFGLYCLMCHGEKGDGQGYLFTSKLYIMQPASLINDRIRNVPDGEIFHTITLGFGVMGAHGAQITRDDRWKIIHYIRQELQK